MLLLALLRAESGLNPRAERWGARTGQAQAFIVAADDAALGELIAVVWPDLGFGYSQRVVAFHERGDRTPTVRNCLAVREWVFGHPDEDIQAAAQRLVGCFRHPTCDGSALSALCIYNAGSDRRGDAAWMGRWAGNVASYEVALAWAEGYRLT